ncbi:DUF4845 domain-containing protein [Saccharospirillum impatiens]|uniref:DUF4845 domain-containing protein n=1 Tax=Saccharospirillum impatiens TaxID=169438 RepID=UPI0004027F45|nr:DUF4845 domain-containing protein [Saccharospirillum impatiens]
MRTPKREQGITILAMAVLLFMVIFFGTLIIKLSGPYYDQFTIDQMISRTSQEMSGGDFLESEFRSRMSKNLSINNIELDLRKDLTFDLRATEPKVVLDYEKRVHIAANIDVVLTFYEEYGL